MEDEEDSWQTNGGCNMMEQLIRRRLVPCIYKLTSVPFELEVLHKKVKVHGSFSHQNAHPRRLSTLLSPQLDEYC